MAYKELKILGGYLLGIYPIFLGAKQLNCMLLYLLKKWH